MLDIVVSNFEKSVFHTYCILKYFNMCYEILMEMCFCYHLFYFIEILILFLIVNFIWWHCYYFYAHNWFTAPMLLAPLFFIALEFQHFLLRQIKCWGNYIKTHFASAFPRQCFCRGWQNFILRASVFTSATSARTSMRSKLVRLLPLLDISPRIRSIMCTIIVVQILLYAMQCGLFSHQKLF